MPLSERTNFTFTTFLCELFQFSQICHYSSWLGSFHSYSSQTHRQQQLFNVFTYKQTIVMVLGNVFKVIIRSYAIASNKPCGLSVCRFVYYTFIFSFNWNCNSINSKQDKEYRMGKNGSPKVKINSNRCQTFRHSTIATSLYCVSLRKCVCMYECVCVWLWQSTTTTCFMAHLYFILCATAYIYV